VCLQSKDWGDAVAATQNGANSMKSYLIVTAALFGLLAVAHLLRTVAEWQQLTTNPGFILEGPGIGILAAALCVWGWRLFRSSGTAAR
jgi:hypothetical protein